jgi:hypothetical protein
MSVNRTALLAGIAAAPMLFAARTIRSAVM